MRIDEFDWDNLIILDAARHDLYEELNGKTAKRRTVGSSSEEFIHKTFSSGDWTDTVVITANPHYHTPLFKKETGRTPENTFKDIINAFSDHQYWNEKEGTVTPEKMVEAVKEAKLTHGTDAKFLIHFMQPHAPFIGSELENDEKREMNVWDLLEEGEYTDQDMWTAYKNNLHRAMPAVDAIDETLDGQTVVTADHGNAFGENNEYGHPSNSSNPVLRQVPFDKR